MRMPLQVLLIEDDDVDRQMVRRLLDVSDLRLDLIEACTAAEANEYLADRSIDCMIVDYHLPDADGMAFIADVRARMAEAAPPAIMLTGAGNERIAVQALKNGVYNYLAKNYTTSKEIEGAVRGAIRERVESVRARENVERLTREAMTDQLTGLGNRRFLEANIEDALADGPARARFALMLLDLNGFKSVNDTLGHSAGDQLLARIAERLADTVRADDVVTRYGGDEFAIIVRADTHPAELKGFARRLADVVSAPVVIGPEEEVSVGVSVGYATAPTDGTTFADLVRIADQRMYDNKSLRRSFPVPADEEQRLEELRRYRVLDTAPDETIDNLTRLAQSALEVPIALVSLVDENRQWFKSRQGLVPEETPRDEAFCAHTICGNDIMVVSDALEDARFCDNPLVRENPNIRFYAGAPLTTPSGHNLGTLCVIDTKPRNLSEQQRKTLEGLAELVMREMDKRRTVTHGR